MKKIALIICLISTIILLNYRIFGDQDNSNSISEESKKLIDEFYKEFGVKITVDYKKVIPKVWFYAPVSCKATPFDEKYLGYTLNILKSSLKKYPKQFLKKNLFSIGLCETIYFYEVEYGATAVYENHSIILAIKKDTIQEWIDSTLNHEFNHLLIFWNDFPKKKWIDCNIVGFDYGNGGIDAIRKGHSNTKRSTICFNEGFVCEYSKSDFIEDVATMFEYAVSDREDFYKRALNYPIIKKKFKILKEFYYSLDHNFNEGFWENKEITEVKQNNPEAKNNNLLDDEGDDGLLNKDDQLYQKDDEKELY